MRNIEKQNCVDSLLDVLETKNQIDCFTNLYDFKDHPNIQRWIQDMTKVEGHDDAHLVLKELGDISQNPPAMEDIAKANIAGFKRILELSS